MNHIPASRGFVLSESQYMFSRRTTRPVMVGKVQIGGGAPVSIQSMTNTHTYEAEATIEQIKRLEDAGCQIIRCTVESPQSLKAFAKIKAGIHIPIIADIHFSHQLAMDVVDEGADKIRVNPGNLGGLDRLKQVVEKCKKHHVAMRVGVNSGSLEKELLAKYGHPTPEAIVESALGYIRFIETLGYHDMVISVKSSHVPTMIQSYRLLAKQCDYPFHVGVTEAGTKVRGIIKSAAGIGAVLSDGIGDTIRVSLTGDPVEEVKVATNLLRSLGYRHDGVDLIACPTCGRTQVDLEKIVDQVELATLNIKTPMKIAIMGCIVNGLGEGAEADLGICAEKGQGVIMEKGKVLRKVAEDRLVPELLKEIERKRVEIEKAGNS
jgi:(E)-4-hydroxy-3-methylbut-2-enyl-diphosphate synthase